MEASALRIVQWFAAEPALRIVAYVIASTGEAEQIREVDVLVDIASRVNDLIMPLANRSDLRIAWQRYHERTRLQVVAMRDAVRKIINQWPSDHHVVLSFFLSTAGFVAQHVASELNLPHVACSRGSDLGRDLFTHDGFGVVDFVLKRATHVVTTNLEHLRFVKQIGGREGGVHVIYNSLPRHVKPVWSRRESKRACLVSVGGYSVKKGTHILLEAVAQLLSEQLPVHLSIVGPTGPGCWDELRQKYFLRYPTQMLMRGMIERDEIETFLTGGDIYCSASLSEGCANGTMLALGLGMPIASTATGALVDLASEVDHVRMVTPGNQPEFTNMLRETVRNVLDGTLRASTAQLIPVLERLSSERERAEWLAIINAAGNGL